MKQAFMIEIALCVLPFTLARKSSRPQDTMALVSKGGGSKVGGPCASHMCSDGYSPKTDYDSFNGNASDAYCCDATCARWTCGTGFKAHPEYINNVGQSDLECCDKTCSIFEECPPHTGVPTSKENVRGVTKEECCRPTCDVHSCIGSWALDVSKSHVVSSKDEDCCQRSCYSVQCDNEQGLIAHPERGDLPGTTTEYCCQKACPYFKEQCPSDTGVPNDKQRKVPFDDSFVGAMQECCDGKCSGHTCASGYTLIESNIDEYVKIASPSCCEPTCKIHDCSFGYASNPVAEDQTQPSDDTCCEKTCEVFSCGFGWLNSTDPAKLSNTNRSNENCCHKSCQGNTCPNGTVLRPDPASIPDTLDPTQSDCCEQDTCKTLRDQRTPTSVQQGGSLSGKDCNDFVDAGNCSLKYKVFNYSGTLTAVACIFDEIVDICRMDDTHVATDCSDLHLHV